MPMQQAACAGCGRPIGGVHHQLGNPADAQLHRQLVYGFAEVGAFKNSAGPKLHIEGYG